MTDPEPVIAGRRRSMLVLFIGVGLVNLATSSTGTAGTLVGAQMVGDTWSGVPRTISTLGTAAATFFLAQLMARHGRRAGVLVGFLSGIVGAAGCAAALILHLPALFFVAIGLIGAANGAAQLARYAAADLYPASRRGMALSTIVWAGTVGGVFGPSLLSPSAGAVAALGMPELSGIFVVSTVAISAALAVAFVLPRRARPAAPAGGRRETGLRQTLLVFAPPAVAIAVVAMIAGQFDMTAVMTMTPVAMQMSGSDLTLIGGVISIHILGMFALAPLSGRLADRLGGVLVVCLGAGTLFLSAVLSVLSGEVALLIAPALFLLGYGWNLCFVGASTLLSVHLNERVRARTQGSVDSLVWLTSAIASLASGAGLAAGGFAGLSIGSAVVTVLPLTILLVAWREPLRARGRAVIPEVVDGELVGGRTGGAGVRGAGPAALRRGDEQDAGDGAP